MREYVLSISNLTMEEQHQKINEAFTSWKGEIEQVDDVCDWRKNIIHATT